MQGRVSAAVDTEQPCVKSVQTTKLVPETNTYREALPYITREHYTTVKVCCGSHIDGFTNKVQN